MNLQLLLISNIITNRKMLLIIVINFAVLRALPEAYVMLKIIRRNKNYFKQI